MGVYTLIHLYTGVIIKEFLVSSTLLVALAIFVNSFYSYYKDSLHIDAIIKKLTQLNFVFTLIALISLMSNSFVETFWYLVPFTADYQVIPRLKLFELEASHYSLAILPLFFYYFWTLLKKFEWSAFYLWLSLALSLMLSFSLGVIAVIIFATILVLGFHSISFVQFTPTKNKLIFLAGSSLLGILILFTFFPDNPLLFRLNNIMTGADTSGRGRTYEAFEIGWKVLQNNNPSVGIGLGQFKLIGRQTLIYYYQFENTPSVARLPNCMAETLVTYGYLGFILKIIAQLFLFVKFKVYKNIYQLSLFFSIFIYQFTGSYLSNNMEYVIWVMAFYPKLIQFNLTSYFKS